MIWRFSLCLLAGWLCVPSSFSGTSGNIGRDMAVRSVVVYESPMAAAVSYLPPLEVRLRKVHIVRPDLIPYPVAFEVVC